MGEKKPDIIVWSEERGYYAKELAYGSNVGAPVIKADDVIGWRLREVSNVNNLFTAKYNEIKAEVEKLIDDYNWNELIYNHVEYNFIPVVGQTYYLYKRENNSLFMSLIEPTQWKKEHVGSFKLDSSNKWNKL
jgi:hypothetical protein